MIRSLQNQTPLDQNCLNSRNRNLTWCSQSLSGGFEWANLMAMKSHFVKLIHDWLAPKMIFDVVPVPASLGVTSNECSDWICAARLGGTLQRYTQWYWVLYQFVEYVMKYTSTKKLQKTNNPNTSKKTFEHHKKRENSKVFVVDTHHEKVWSHSLWHREDHTHFLLGILRYFFGHPTHPKILEFRKKMNSKLLAWHQHTSRILRVPKRKGALSFFLEFRKKRNSKIFLPPNTSKILRVPEKEL